MSYVICPINCDKDANIYGRDAYQSTSNVCGAAIVDGSMPVIGGLIGVIRMSGQNIYS